MHSRPARSQNEFTGENKTKNKMSHGRGESYNNFVLTTLSHSVNIVVMIENCNTWEYLRLRMSIGKKIMTSVMYNSRDTM